MSFAKAHRHRKRAAGANRALHLRDTAVQLHQFLNDRQSDPRSFMGPGGYMLNAMKALEHLLALVVGNAHAGVADLQLHGAVHWLQRERYFALQRELERI